MLLFHREDGYLQKIHELTANRGVDVILEMAANSNLHKDLEVAAIGGRIVMVGTYGNQATVDPTVVIGKGITLVGVNLFSVSPR